MIHVQQINHWKWDEFRSAELISPVLVGIRSKRLFHTRHVTFLQVNRLCCLLTIRLTWSFQEGSEFYFQSGRCCTCRHPATRRWCGLKPANQTESAQEDVIIQERGIPHSSSQKIKVFIQVQFTFILLTYENVNYRIKFTLLIIILCVWIYCKCLVTLKLINRC